MDENITNQITDVKPENVLSQDPGKKGKICNNCSLLFTAGILLVIAGLVYLFIQIYLPSQQGSRADKEIQKREMVKDEKNKEETASETQEDSVGNMTDTELMEDLIDDVEKEFDNLEAELDIMEQEVTQLENAEL